MSTRLTSRGPKRTKTLHGVVPAGLAPEERRLDRPPDGWTLAFAPVRTRTLLWLDSNLLRASDSVVSGVSRRQFLKRTGQVAAVVGLGLTRVLWGIGPARADFSCSCNCEDMGNPPGLPGPCGPSPLCDPQHCNSEGRCQTSDPGVSRRISIKLNRWPGFDCTSGTEDNCWDEDCCAETGHLVRCCDCCTGPTQPPFCKTCTGRFRCICRKSIMTC